MLDLYFIMVFMIIAAMVAVYTEDLISSVVAIGAVGLGLSVAFLILKAPDLAITQLVVEILILVILIRATINKDIPPIRSRRTYLKVLLVIAFIGIFLTFAYAALNDLPKFGEPLLRVARNYIDSGLEKTGAANLVVSIILNFRAYDTLGEATVLFAAIIGAITVLRRTSHKKIDERVDEDY